MSMHAQDWMDQNNNRAEAVQKLIDYCMTHNLDYNFTEKEFRIKLPDVEPLPTVQEQRPGKKRKTFNTDNWPSSGIDETELPPPEKPLNEGETPDE